MKKLKLLLPFEDNPVDEDKRLKLFKSFDPNGNGYLSLAEVDKNVRDVLKSDDLFSMKPVLIRAFNASKDCGVSTKKNSKNAGDYVELEEFRYLLMYLYQYFQYYCEYMSMDSDGDKKLSLDEFKKSRSMLESHGLKVDDFEETFKEIDTDGSGVLLFDEFADWAI